jgi:hypothetical protein
MLFQDHGTDFVKGSLYGLDLADDVNTISLFFDHTLDPAQVTLDIFKPG